MTKQRRNGLWHDFKEFISRGNVVDLAVAVIIGGAFGKIISSLVEDVVMPGIVNPIVSQAGTDWREATIGPDIRIGSFIGSIVDFLIIAFVIFLVVQAFEKFKRKEEVAAAEEAPPQPDPTVVQQQLTAALDRLNHTIQSRNGGV
jgi:large conductance mechanosensitive channel